MTVIDAIRSLLAATVAAFSASAAVPVPVSVSAGQPTAILTVNSVACASPAYCLAVGQDVTTQHGCAEAWDGSAWRVIPVPDPGTPEALWDVACYAAGQCVTVGTYFDAAGVGIALAARWDGSRWRLLRPASPGAADLLDGIACPSPGRCVAVGATLASAYQPLAEQWDGVRWRQLTSPAPARSGAGRGRLSCRGVVRGGRRRGRRGRDDAHPRGAVERQALARAADAAGGTQQPG